MTRRRSYRIGDVVGFRLRAGDEDLMAYLSQCHGRGELSVLLRRLLKEHVAAKTGPVPVERVRQTLLWLSQMLERLGSGELPLAPALPAARETGSSDSDRAARRNALVRFALDEDGEAS